jgi:hypothetical protein
MPLLALTVVLLWVQRRITSRKGFVSLTGKGGERRPFRWARGSGCCWAGAGVTAVGGDAAGHPARRVVLQGLGPRLSLATTLNFRNIFFEQFDGALCARPR